MVQVVNRCSSDGGNRSHKVKEPTIHEQLCGQTIIWTEHRSSWKGFKSCSGMFLSSLFLRRNWAVGGRHTNIHLLCKHCQVWVLLLRLPVYFSVKRATLSTDPYWQNPKTKNSCVRVSFPWKCTQLQTVFCCSEAVFTTHPSACID